MNRIRTLILLATLTALLLWAGQALGGQNGLVFALVLAGLMNFGAYWFSDKIVLRMYGAQEISPAEAPELYAMVRDLALRASLPMPRLYLIPEEAPNAFATGRDPQHGVVAVTQGLQRLLNRDEVAGVIAHELAHIKHRDTLVMCVAATLASALRKIENWSGRSPMDSASPATAHLFIQNPFAGGGLLRLFSTHPPTKARVERLEAMATRGYAVAV